MKQLFITLLLVSFILLGCKKDDNPNLSSLIIAKWSLLSSKNELFINGSISSTSTTEYNPSDYVEFKKDGICQSVAKGQLDVSGYRVENDTLIFGSTRKAVIKILTNSSLIYSFKNEIDSTYSEVITFNMKK